ncbi:MAG: hypothetical protein DBY24_00530 [Prevotellaceae bacterium]|nr:MAG: hypothetical protein DBY24_00530 [Prevotellaceae bacterium]
MLKKREKETASAALLLESVLKLLFEKSARFWFYLQTILFYQLSTVILILKCSFHMVQTIIIIEFLYKFSICSMPNAFPLCISAFYL